MKRNEKKKNPKEERRGGRMFAQLIIEKPQDYFTLIFLGGKRHVSLSLQNEELYLNLFQIIYG